MVGFLFSAPLFPRRPGERRVGTLHPIDPRQQPPELAADHRCIAEGTDAGDVDVDRCATVRAALRGDGPRLTGGHRRWTLKDPVFGPVPAIRVAADDPSASVEVVVG